MYSIDNPPFPSRNVVCHCHKSKIYTGEREGSILTILTVCDRYLIRIIETDGSFVDCENLEDVESGCQSLSMIEEEKVFKEEAS